MGRGRRKLGETKKAGQYVRAKGRILGEVRQILKTRIVNKTKDKSATLWLDPPRYHRCVYIGRRIHLILWPAGVPFRNLSTLTKAQLSKLLVALKKRGRGAVRFVDVTDEEAAAHARDVEGVIPGAYEAADIGIGHPGRSDIKKSRFKNGKPVSKKRKLRTKGAITPKRVED
ncbi:hypothetical protein K466DRAFT_515642 [Polyporus arcularius HHB13444]|uniref:Uncharacterized protein n=1 Tax=Polyporus arcularius HHB13444 TaxID=1314778 RepID=A0A5C3PRN6_9APHY|nr:hypothetical protein K466DRAFT_515642 [Polyporus arcularius HHB13444]